MPPILIIDSDTTLASTLAGLLRGDGWTVATARTAAEALRLEEQLRPALALIEVMLPDDSGLELCRRWHRLRPELRLMMLTARGDPFDRALGLDLGADDYLAKPFEPRELLARVRALLRRHPQQAGTPALDADLHLGPLTVHVLRREASVRGQPLALSSIEFKLLIALARHPGAVVSRDKLNAAVQPGNYRPLDRTVDMQVARLRKRLAAALAGADWIRTVRGEGYAFVPPAVDALGADEAPTATQARAASSAMSTSMAATMAATLSDPSPVMYTYLGMHQDHPGVPRAAPCPAEH